MKNIFKNEKFWLVAAGAAGVIVGKKIITAKKTRQLAVTGLAKGMKLTSDAKSAFQSMKDRLRISATRLRSRQVSTQTQITPRKAKTDNALQDHIG